MEEVSNSDGKMLEGNSQQEMSKREDDNDWQEKDEPQRPWKQGWQHSGGGKRDSRGSATWAPREWRHEDGDPKRQRIDERWGDETSTWHNGRWGSWNDDKQQGETKYVFTVSQQGSNEFEITGTPDAVKKAKDMMNQIIGADLQQLCSGQPSDRSVEQTFPLPSKMFGKLIGMEGSNIKQIRKHTGARIDIEKGKKG